MEKLRLTRVFNQVIVANPAESLVRFNFRMHRQEHAVGNLHRFVGVKARPLYHIIPLSVGIKSDFLRITFVS